MWTIKSHKRSIDLRPGLSSPVIYLVLMVLGFLIYSNTFFSPFVFDDFGAIDNSPIRHLNLPIFLEAFNTRFIVGLSLAFNYALGKENVVGYHLFNTLVHVLNSFLVYQFVCLTFSAMGGSASGGRTSKASPKLLGFLTALIFLTHPIQTQTVNYIWQRATSLATFFYLGAILFYGKARLKSSLRDYGICLLLTVLGMFTKEIVFTLPLAIGLYEVIFLRQLPLKTAQKILFWLPLALTLLLIPWTMTQANEHTLGLVRPADARFDPQSGNLFQSLWKMTNTSSPKRMPEKDFVLTELNVLRTYLRLFVLPLHQNVDYDYPRARSLLEPNTFLSFLLLMSLLILGVGLLKRHPLLAFGIFWFFLTTSVEALVAQEEFIFEHRMYLPMVGFGVFFVTAMSEFFKDHPRRLTWVMLGIVACTSFLTYQRNLVWRDEFTLWDDAIKKSPKKARPYNGRGSVAALTGRLDQALADFNKAIELQPTFADFYVNRGDVYTEKRLFDKALLDYNKAIELVPRFYIAYNRRSSMHYKMGLFDQALADSNKAIEINPAFAISYVNRGVTYADRGLLDKAFAEYNKAIELEPNLALAYLNRGYAHKKRGDLDKALADCNKVIKINPNLADGYNSRAVCYKDKGLLKLALSDLTHAIKIAPKDGKIYNNRAYFYFLKKEYDKSRQEVTKAQTLGFAVDAQFVERLKNEK